MSTRSAAIYPDTRYCGTMTATAAALGVDTAQTFLDPPGVALNSSLHNLGLVRYQKWTGVLAAIRLLSLRVVEALEARGITRLVVFATELGDADRHFVEQIVDLGINVQLSSGRSAPVGVTAGMDPWTLVSRGDPWGLREAENRATAEDLDDAEFVMCLARGRLMSNDPRAALSLLESPTPVDEVEQSRLLYERAMVWLRHLPPGQRDPRKAAALLTEAKDLIRGLSSADAMLERALVMNAEALMKREDPGEAASLLHAAISLVDSGELGAIALDSTKAILHSLASVLTGEECWNHTRIALGLDPNNHQYLVDAFTQAMECGYSNELSDLLPQMERLAAFSVDAAVALANWFASQGQRMIALTYYERAHRLLPGFIEVAPESRTGGWLVRLPARAGGVRTLAG